MVRTKYNRPKRAAKARRGVNTLITDIRMSPDGERFDVSAHDFRTIWRTHIKPRLRHDTACPEVRPGEYMGTLFGSHIYIKETV